MGIDVNGRRGTRKPEGQVEEKARVPVAIPSCPIISYHTISEPLSRSLSLAVSLPLQSGAGLPSCTPGRRSSHQLHDCTCWPSMAPHPTHTCTAQSATRGSFRERGLEQQWDRLALRGLMAIYRYCECSSAHSRLKPGQRLAVAAVYRCIYVS